MPNLDLSIIPYQAITQDPASGLQPVSLKFYHANVKKTKKNVTQIEIKIENFEPTAITISSQYLTLLNTFYNFIKTA